MAVTGCGVSSSSAAKSPASGSVQTASAQAALLRCVPDKLAFGRLSKGSKQTVRFRLENAGTTPVEVGATTTSCDCFTVELAATTVPPGASVEAKARVDFSTHPNFSGNLALEATAQSSRGEIAFVVRAAVTVE